MIHLLSVVVCLEWKSAGTWVLVAHVWEPQVSCSTVKDICHVLFTVCTKRCQTLWVIFFSSWIFAANLVQLKTSIKIINQIVFGMKLLLGIGVSIQCLIYSDYFCFGFRRRFNDLFVYCRRSHSSSEWRGHIAIKRERVLSQQLLLHHRCWHRHCHFLFLHILFLSAVLPCLHPTTTHTRTHTTI